MIATASSRSFCGNFGKEQQVPMGGGTWREVEQSLRQHYLNLAADTLRFLEHGHG
jgi:hypothetical protein